ncbi:MAG: IPT/TIG domain-containing protein [Nanoarchaeota archaeon]
MNNKKWMIGILCAFTLFILSCGSNGVIRDPTACTEEAKICPDGSAVGRTGPNCKFAPCPVDESIYLDYIAPSSGPVGTEVTIYGSGFSVRNNAVKFGSGYMERFDSEDGKTIKFTVPDGLTPKGTESFMKTSPGRFSVSVVNAEGMESNKASFTVVETGKSCTRDAKQCPDGSYVGRTGPNCEFAECPTAGIACTPEERTNQGCLAIYSPVCGWFKSSVNCVKYPCAGDYSNGCTACADNMVEYYTYGACPPELNGGTACTQEAMQCSDGSYVGRTGPNCEFASCPA